MKAPAQAKRDKANRCRDRRVARADHEARKRMTNQTYREKMHGISKQIASDANMAAADRPDASVPDHVQQEKALRKKYARKDKNARVIGMAERLSQHCFDTRNWDGGACDCPLWDKEYHRCACSSPAAWPISRIKESAQHGGNRN